ncbi:MAG: hypothetical protein HC930_17150 [Hydrococcus sp. SU_1_0]|nr:hypothetical protein [Hydrococcus sp. SU_1_0]
MTIYQTNMTDHTMDLSNSPDQELIAQLELATKDLLWFSEAEYPIQVVYWHDATSFTQDTLLRQQQFSPETKITIQEFHSFLRWPPNKKLGITRRNKLRS